MPHPAALSTQLGPGLVRHLAGAGEALTGYLPATVIAVWEGGMDFFGPGQTPSRAKV